MNNELEKSRTKTGRGERSKILPALHVPGIGEYALVMHILHTGDASKWPKIEGQLAKSE